MYEEVAGERDECNMCGKTERRLQKDGNGTMVDRMGCHKISLILRKNKQIAATGLNMLHGVIEMARIVVPSCTAWHTDSRRFSNRHFLEQSRDYSWNRTE